MVTLGPLHRSLVPSLPLCHSSGSFCIWFCLYIFHVHHTNLLGCDSISVLMAHPSLPQQVSADFQFSLTLSCSHFNLVSHLIFFTLLFAPSSVPVFVLFIFSSVFLVHVWCFMFYRPLLYLLIFYSFFSHFHAEILCCSIFISLTIKCKELNLCHVIEHFVNFFSLVMTRDYWLTLISNWSLS